MKKHHDHGNSFKGKHLIGSGLRFRSLAHCRHSGKHRNMQQDMALEKELRVLRLDPKTAEGESVSH